MDKMHAFEDELDDFDKELATIMGKSDTSGRDSIIYGVSKHGSNLEVGTMIPGSGDSLQKEPKKKDINTLLRQLRAEGE